MSTLLWPVAITSVEGKQVIFGVAKKKKKQTKKNKKQRHGHLWLDCISHGHHPGN